jgi:hypothetical protein
MVFGIVSGKHLIYRDFLEEGDRENLEQCVERGVEGEALLDDCDEDVDRDGDPNCSREKLPYLVWHDSKDGAAKKYPASIRCGPRFTGFR